MNVPAKIQHVKEWNIELRECEFPSAERDTCEEESTVRRYAPVFLIAFTSICSCSSFAQSVELLITMPLLDKPFRCLPRMQKVVLVSSHLSHCSWRE